MSRIAAVGVIASMALGTAEPVRADAGDAIAGALIGGIIGHAIANDQNRKRTVYRSTSSRKPTISSAQREANREVQTSLNYFGFPVGTPDGAIGPRSRAAISEYQAVMGYPSTGQLSDFERDLLVTSYYRAQSGGPTTAQMIATNPMGVRGLLIAYRNERFGTPGGLAVTAAPAPAPVAPEVVAVPVLPAPLPAPVVEPTMAAAPALPGFLNAATSQVSLASTCNKVSLLTNSNGGYVTVAAMTDPAFALSEQFCLARTYAMAQGEELAGAVPGFTPAQIAEQCQSFGPVLANYVSSLSVQPRDEVLKATAGFVVSSGMAPAQLAGTAKICLGVGYTTDQMDVAIGSALLLSSLGEKGYAELIGHHLSQGFGASQRPDLAMAWYDLGFEAVAAGGTVFAPGLPDRTELIRKASYTLGGRSDAGAGREEQALPVFSLTAPVTASAAP